MTPEIGSYGSSDLAEVDRKKKKKVHAVMCRVVRRVNKELKSLKSVCNDAHSLLLSPSVLL